MIRTWATALPTAESEHTLAALEILHGQHGEVQILRHSAALLTVLIRPEAAERIVDECESLAQHLWTVARGTGQDQEMTPALLDRVPREEGKLLVWAALDHWSGDLTRMFLHLAGHRRACAGQSWSGLPETVRAPLAALLDASFADHLAVLCVLSRSLHWLYLTDEDWTRRHVLPAFRWPADTDQDHAAADAAWQGFLTNPTCDGTVLGILERDFLLACTPRLHEALRPALVDTLARIAVHVPADTGPVASLITKFISESTLTERTAWAQTVGWILSKQDARAAETTWSSLLSPYWQRRLASNPRALESAETDEMLVWVLHCGDHFPEAARLMRACPARVANTYRFFHYFADHPALTSHTVAACELLEFVLKHTDDPGHADDQIARVVTTLVARQVASTKTLLTNVCNRAGELGCVDASAWLTLVESMP